MELRVSRAFLTNLHFHTHCSLDGILCLVFLSTFLPFRFSSTISLFFYSFGVRFVPFFQIQPGATAACMELLCIALILGELKIQQISRKYVEFACTAAFIVHFLVFTTNYTTEIFVHSANYLFAFMWLCECCIKVQDVEWVRSNERITSNCARWVCLCLCVYGILDKWRETEKRWNDTFTSYSNFKPLQNRMCTQHI